MVSAYGLLYNNNLYLSHIKCDNVATASCSTHQRIGFICMFDSCIENDFSFTFRSNSGKILTLNSRYFSFRIAYTYVNI